MENQPVTNSLSNNTSNVEESIINPSNMRFWIVIGIIFVVVVIAIGIHLYLNSPPTTTTTSTTTPSSTTPSSTTTTPSTTTPSSSSTSVPSPYSSSTNSNISSPTELTNTSMNASHNDNESILAATDQYSDNTLNNSLSNSTTQYNKSNAPIADDSYNSTIQSGKSKTGWCYIGEEKGYRSCLEVGNNDTCMSGDIFPSKDICINPSLRS
jgi:cytoskeletal protein RodZ